MAQNRKFNTSFIPKQPAANRPKKKGEQKSGVRSHTLNLLSMLTLVLFVASLAGVAGTFLYQIWLERSIEDKKTALAAAEQTFAPDEIERLQRIDQQFSTADELLRSHVAFSNFFETLRTHTATNVEFNSFTYQMQQGSAAVEMEGRAQSFNTLVNQKDELEAASAFTDPRITDLQLDSAGNVSFMVQTSVSNDLITYGSESEQATTTPAQQEPTATSTEPAAGTTTEPTAGTSTAYLTEVDHNVSF